MEFLKNNKLFDFKYAGKSIWDYDVKTKTEENGNTITTEYCLSGKLKVTNIAKKNDDAYEWVNYFENISNDPTEIISELWDCCAEFPMPHEEPPKMVSYQPDFGDVTAVYAPKGSDWDSYEFCDFPDHKIDNRYSGHIYQGETKKYATSGGRSSEKSAPFFNVHKDGKGYIFAVGWTGQWNCEITRNAETVLFKSKIEDTYFRLLPGEKVRTSSVVIMPYEGTVTESQNKWRKLIREHYSLVGQEGRDSHGPLSSAFWGGMQTEKLLERIDIIKKNNLPFEYVWVDAGWYGSTTKPNPDDFDSDWAKLTGDWRVSPLIHPNGLRDVAACAHDAGMKFLLWFEPERACRKAPIVKEHPEYLIDIDDEHLLLNLGNEDAWNYCFNTLAGQIETIGIDCYRQDFNISALPYWRKNDTEERKGITEIKHINGLYRLWDALLEKFPHLLIDNVASGGRRIDIETLRRSIPLWRSDFQCPANHVPEGSQCQNLSFNSWLPYSGTATGRIYDTYRIRSTYAPALAAVYALNEQEPFGDDSEKMQWLKDRLDEYLKVRPLMEEDFYPLTEISDRNDVWAVSQFDRPSKNDGVLLMFRREKSMYETARFELYGIDTNAEYIFTDADTDEKTRISGKDLAENGFAVTMKEKRSSKIYFYTKNI